MKKILLVALCALLVIGQANRVQGNNIFLCEEDDLIELHSEVIVI